MKGLDSGRLLVRSRAGKKPGASDVTMDKLQNPSGSQFPYLSHQDKNSVSHRAIKRINKQLYG